MRRILALAVMLAATSSVLCAQTQSRKHPVEEFFMAGIGVREVAGDTVVSDFRWRVYPMGRGPAFHGVGSGVYVRRGDGRVEVLEHETVVRVDEGLAPGKK